MGSSRPGTLPANLQGIWNDAFIPAWDSKFTININTEMNYWPAEVANLEECHEPLFDLIERLRVPGGGRCVGGPPSLGALFVRSRPAIPPRQGVSHNATGGRIHSRPDGGRRQESAADRPFNVAGERICLRWRAGDDLHEPHDGCPTHSGPV